MAGRDYKGANFGMRDTREIRGSGVGQSDNSVKVPFAVGDSQWRDKLFEQMGRDGAQVLNKMADIEYSNLYLGGQAKVGMIESEDEIEGNPLTRDWKVAGYRDTMGKLALADNEAQFSVDIGQLRQQDPEKFQEYLSQRRQKIIPGLSSMSREARAAASGQLLLQDRAATQRYTAEHQKFIIETKAQAFQTQNGASIGALKQAQFSESSDGMSPGFNGQLRSHAGMLVGSVWMDKSLPLDVQQKLTFEAIGQALSNDLVPLYDYMRDTPIPDGKGGTSTLLSRLDGEQQTKLANQYRESMARTNDVRAFSRIVDLDKEEAAIKNNASTTTYTQLESTLRAMVVNKETTAERAASVLALKSSQAYKAERNSSIGAAWARGDDNAMNGMDANDADGVKAYEDMMNRNKIPNDQRIGLWMSAGMNGRDGAFTKVGEALGVSLRQMRSPDGKVLPQHIENVRAINNYLQNIQGPGQDNARTRVLAGLGEKDRMLAERVFAQVNDNKATYDEALQKAVDLETKEQGLTPGKSAAMGQSTAAQMQKEIADLDARGWFSTAMSGIRSMVPGAGGAEAHANNVIRPDTFAFEDFGGNSKTTQFYVNQSRAEVLAEANAVILSSPYSTSQEAIRVAKANVAARVIETKQGPLFMPKNVDLMQAYGVAPGNQAVIGKAIDSLLKSKQEELRSTLNVPIKDDARWELMFTNGRLFAQQYVKGVRQGQGDFIPPEAIKARITEMTNAEQERANMRHGSGRVVVEGGVTIKYNGMNTAGVPANWMFDLRDNLVRNEGVRNVPYADLSGKKLKDGSTVMTVGVGVSSHNPHYPKVRPDGTVEASEVMKSFLAASSDAAAVGYRTARTAAVDNTYGFQLMSELAYQSGGAFMTQQNKTGERYRELGAALLKKDEAKALEAFKGTAAWYYSRDPKDPKKVTSRQQHYLNLISKSIKG